MKTLFTLLLVFATVAILQAQTNIPLTNGDCSTDATFTVSGTSSQTVSGYTIAQTSPAALNLTTSGISGGTMKLFGTTNGSAQGNLTVTTDKVDISSYPVDATFSFSGTFSCGTPTSQAQPYNVTIISYAADGVTIISSGVTSNVLTLTKAQGNSNVAAGTPINVSATAVMKLNTVTPGLDAKYLSFQVQMGKMLTNNLTFDNFTLVKLDAPATTVVGTPSNSTLSYEVGNGPSTESTFTVSGTSLGTDPVVLTPGSNMEISLTSGSEFVANPSTISLTPTSGTVNSTTIYARLKSGINGIGTVSASSSRITITHLTAGSKTVQFTGNINGLAISNPLSTAIGYLVNNGPSAEQTFNVSGSGLTTDLVVTPGADMEISTTPGSGFASTPITITQSGGTVALTAIYARLKSGLTAGDYNDVTTKVIASSTGYTSKEIQFIGTVDLGTGIENQNTADLKCFTTNNTIHILGVEAGKQIEIYNSVGQMIKSVTATNDNNISFTAEGMYFVKVDKFVTKVVL